MVASLTLLLASKHPPLLLNDNVLCHGRLMERTNIAFRLSYNVIVKIASLPRSANACLIQISQSLNVFQNDTFPFPALVPVTSASKNE